MCGLTGILKSHKPRSQRELRSICLMFTHLLIGSEHRGPHATGAAVVSESGEYVLRKAPLPASEFVLSDGYRQLTNQVACDTTLLMGHTRWPTRGSHLDNRCNHPLVGDGHGDGGGSHQCIATHNGDIPNHMVLSRQMNLRRELEVDSEVILRLAEKNLSSSEIDPVGLAEDISRCQGRLSAVVIATSDPTKILLVKGNQPLELRYHKRRGLVAYASEAKILDAAIGNARGWTDIEIPAWHIAVVDTRSLVMPLTLYPIPALWDDIDWRPRACR
ncbi:MAG: class II glutamine amidotransferase [Armatimonadota bacterium]